MTIGSEEDVQNKLVIPYLRDELGLDVKDMDFQRTLKVKIGHKEYELDSKKQPFTALGRYDALVKKGESNLFILEMKGPDIKISIDDVEQAISYARLVHPIAPIVIVTNGRDWKIYDTLTKKEMDKDDSRIKGPYQAQLPDEKYFDAMKVFFNLSRENVLAFCREQVYQYAMELVGSPDDKDKKYIRELFEPWTELDNFFSEFLSSSKKSFAVVGDSGTGKTCWVYDTANKILENGHAVFFYRAVSVKGDILSMMSRDLGWELADNDIGLKGPKRLFEIFKHEPVFLFVDGLDEIDLADARAMTDDILRMLAHQGVRLVLSCKTAEWARLLGSYEPTRLSAELYKFNDKTAYMLANLEEGQFHKMIERYRGFYQFTGSIDEKVMRDSRKNAFLIKIMFQVAQEHNLENISYGAMEFYDKYFGILYKRFKNPELAQQMLPRIAKSFYERNIGHIEYSTLHEDLQLGSSEPIPEELFRYNILEKQENTHTTNVRFYFNNLRDFLIAFRHLKFDLMPDHELDEHIRQMQPFGVHLDVLTLYYLLAPESHKRVLDRDAPLNALKYVQNYQSILDTYFSSFKASFDPYTWDKIGFVCYLDFSSRMIYEHGFRPIRGSQEEVLLLPRSDQSNPSHAPFVPGVSRLKWSTASWGFKDIDVKAEVVWGEIEPALKDIIEEGLLNESQNQYLLMERVLATCLTCLSDELAIDPHESTLFSLPLDLGHVLYHLLFNRARRIVASTHNLPEADVAVMNEARQLAEKEVFLEDGAPYQPGDYEDYIEWRLLEDIRALRGMGITALENDVLLNWYGQGITPEWDNKEVPDGVLIEKFYSIFLDEYKNYSFALFVFLDGYMVR